MSGDSKKNIIIIKRKKKSGPPPHHGGSWKVAYADFVTAMMAFFLLMWLLNVTSVEQKKGIASYFSPLTLSNPPTAQEISFEKADKQTFEDSDDREIEADNPEIRGPEENVVDRVVSLEGKNQSISGKLGKMPEKKTANNHTEVGLYRQKTAQNVKVTDDSGVLKKEPNPQNTSKMMDSGVTDQVNSQKQEKHPTQTFELKKSQEEKVDEKKEDKKEDFKGQNMMDATKVKEMENKLKEELKRVSEIAAYEQEKKRFDEIARSLKQAIQDMPELKEVAKNLVMDLTEEGLRIQIVDELKKPMFASGSAVMFDYTKKLIERVGKSIAQVNNRISISGHTDSVPYKTKNGYSNWELSSDRAHASRRSLVGGGVDPLRIISVVGKEDKEHLFPDKPNSPENRRISLTLLFDQKLSKENKERLEKDLKKDLGSPNAVVPLKPETPVPIKPTEPKPEPQVRTESKDALPKLEGEIIRFTPSA